MPTDNARDMARNRKVQKDFYSYTFSVASIAAAANATDTISIQANAAFIIEKSTFFAAIADATQTDSSRVIPLVTIAMTDSGSGRNLQNTAVPIPSTAGVGELPFIWPQPRMIQASASLLATFVNFSSATTYTNLTFTLFGYQIFEF